MQHRITKLYLPIKLPSAFGTQPSGHAATRAAIRNFLATCGARGTRPSGRSRRRRTARAPGSRSTGPIDPGLTRVARHDAEAAREHGIPLSAGRCRSDRVRRHRLPRRRPSVPGSRSGARATTAPPASSPADPLSTGQQAADRAHSELRAPGERANAELKNWRILCKIRSSPAHASVLVNAIQTLTINAETM